MQESDFTDEKETSICLPLPSDLLRLNAPTRLAPHDEMLDSVGLDHYFGSGMSAAWAIDNIVRCRSAVVSDPSFPADILDFGSGCGRVARFISHGSRTHTCM